MASEKDYSDWEIGIKATSLAEEMKAFVVRIAEGQYPDEDEAAAEYQKIMDEYRIDFEK